MALELVSGPNTIYDFQVSGSPLIPLTVSTGQNAFYTDGIGLCTYSASTYWVVQLDGTACARGYQLSSYPFTLDLLRPGEYIVHPAVFDDRIYEFDKRSGTIGDLIINTGIIGDLYQITVRASDRYLQIVNSLVRYRPFNLSAAFVNEATLTGAGSGLATVSRTANERVLAVVWPSGEVLYYDVVAKAQVSGSANIGVNVGAWYSLKHDIFVALSTANTMKIFANAPRPSSLSNPVAITPLTQGRVSQVRVRLLGSNNEACPDELVDWSITAGVGALVRAQSTTDASGYAYNDYVAPVTGGAGSPYGNATIQAQVLF